MDYVKARYGANYAPNTRETFRRQVLHQFMQTGMVDHNPFNPDLPTNSPQTHYAVSMQALATVRAFGTADWDDAVLAWRTPDATLRQQSARRRHMVAVTTPDGQTLELSPGKHNAVQKAVVEEFAPRFAAGAHLLYLGDTAKKDLVVDDIRLAELGVVLTDHDKLPDVILHQPERDRLFLIEAVTSHGPVSDKRVRELESMLSQCSARRIFVTAFPDLAEFRKHMKAIAWETEVWLCDEPDHMIHFDGDRFL